MIHAFNHALAQTLQAVSAGVLTQGIPVPGIHFVPTFMQMNQRIDKNLRTDIHPTVQGYRVLADTFWEVIRTSVIQY